MPFSFHPLVPSGIAVAIACLACGKTPTGTLALTTGGEGDALTRAPAPTALLVDLVGTDGKAQPLGRIELPATTVTLPDQPTSATGAVRVTGKDASGTVRVIGQSLPVQFSGLTDGTLTIFLQRVGELARMPGALVDARQAPLLAIVGGRYVLVAGGTDSGTARTTQIYDLLSWAPFANPPTLPRIPRSLVAQGARALAIDDEGASLLDLTDGSFSTVSPPSGGTFAEVAGGTTTYAPDGSAYVVGATRGTGAPSARVFKVDADGTLSFLALSAPRVGARAAWVEGRGLYVGGGSATAAGGEVIATGATAASPLALPPDATTGAGAVAIDGTHVLVAGGLDAGADPGVRLFDLACSASCGPSAWPSLASPLTHATVLGLPAGAVLIVGEDATGASRVTRADPKIATEIPLKIPRNYARGIVLPTGEVAIAGGANVLESFAP